MIYCKESVEKSDFLNEAYRDLKIEYPKFFKMDALSKLAFLAAEVLLKESILAKNAPNPNTAVILSNSASSIEVDTRFQASMRDFPSPSLFVYTLPNVMIGEICIRHQITGENMVLITESQNSKSLSDIIIAIDQEVEIQHYLIGYVDYTEEKQEALLAWIEKQEKFLTQKEQAEIYSFTINQDYSKKSCKFAHFFFIKLIII
ncbi:MAG: hypothetical protein RR034_03795 [Bacteroidales bacterium]